MNDDRKYDVEISDELQELLEKDKREVPIATFEMLKIHIRRATGELIRTAREEADMTQKDLAEKLERRQAYISDLETGKSLPDIHMVMVLAHYLKKPVEFFIPAAYRNMFNPEQIKRNELTPEEEDLIRRIRSIEPEFSRGLAVHMLKAVIEWDQKYMDWMNNQ